VDDQLRYLRADVEANLDVPDFADVAARGHRIHRRRTIAVSAGIAVVVAIIAVGLTRPFDSQRTMQPVERPAPAPTLDHKAAWAVLRNPDAQVDPDHSKVDGLGDTLSRVQVYNPSFSGNIGPCPTSGHSTALWWTGANGRTSAWLDAPRPLVPLADGFVVGAVRAECRTAASDNDAYFVDSSGTPHGITWSGRAEHVCAARPTYLGCRYDFADRRVSLVPPVNLPVGAVLMQSGRSSGMLWARSAHSRRIYWSTDGRTWRSRSTSLPAGAIVSASASGDRAVLAGNTFVEYTDDGGATWHSRDLSTALRPIVIGDVDWTVTRAGNLLGVTELVGRGDVLFRSTDPSWRRFVVTKVHTDEGLVRPWVEGGVVVVPDGNRFAVSGDEGATWRLTRPPP
jgi:hypothetical protein